MAMNSNTIKRVYNVALIILVHSSVFAKDLGVYGETFPIEEKDFKEVIFEKLHLMQQNGEMDKLKEKFIRDVKAHAIRPSSVRGLTTTQMPQTFYYDPTYTAKENITDEKGKIIIKAGTKANPLDTVTLRSAMLFFNADDSRQINWVKQEIKKHNLVKIILVQGNVKKTSELLNERIYFDQAGSISQKLGIKHIPCVVTQAGRRLEIKEINIDGLEHKMNTESSIKK